MDAIGIINKNINELICDYSNQTRAEYQKIYMKKYINNSKNHICDICNGKYKSYNKYLHEQTNKHKQCLNLIKKNI
jgi:hypothetical protein